MPHFGTFAPPVPVIFHVIPIRNLGIGHLSGIKLSHSVSELVSGCTCSAMAAEHAKSFTCIHCRWLSKASTRSFMSALYSGVWGGWVERGWDACSRRLKDPNSYQGQEQSSPTVEVWGGGGSLTINSPETMESYLRVIFPLISRNLIRETRL